MPSVKNVFQSLSGKLKIGEQGSVGAHLNSIRKPAPPQKLFVDKYFQQTKSSESGLSDGDVRKKLSEKWLKLSSIQKEEFFKASEEDHKRYDKEVGSLPDAERKALADKKEHDQEFRHTQDQLRQKHNMPRRPSTPFAVFLNEHRGEKEEEESMNAFSVRMQHKWSQLSTDFKEGQKKQYALDKAKYEMDLKAWQNKMIAGGHEKDMKILMSHKAPSKH